MVVSLGLNRNVQTKLTTNTYNKMFQLQESNKASKDFISNNIYNIINGADT